jgi:hypothetical protein
MSVDVMINGFIIREDGFTGTGLHGLEQNNNKELFSGISYEGRDTTEVSHFQPASSGRHCALTAILRFPLAVYLKNHSVW